MNIEIESYYELLALHKTLMAVKFDEYSSLKDAQGSPLTASLAFKVFDLLVSSSFDEGQKKRAQDWLEWQRADRNRLETKLLLKHIADSAWWGEAAPQEREEYVRDFMAPLILSDEAFNEILKHE